MLGHHGLQQNIPPAAGSAVRGAGSHAKRKQSQDAAGRGGNSDAWLETRLHRWHRARIIDDEQVQRILALEGVEALRLSAAGPGLLEAFVYLGLVVACVGAIALIGQHWDALATWARIGAFAGPALLALALGAILHRASRPELRRAVAIAWLVAVVLTLGAVVVAGIEAGWANVDAILAASATATLMALVLWALNRAHAQVIAIAGSLFLFADALAGKFPVAQGNIDWTIQGMFILACGVIAIALAETGWFTPRVSARTVAAAALVWGPFVAGYSYAHTDALWAQLLLFLTAGLLIALALARASFTYMLGGVGGMFLGLESFIFLHFEAQVGAPVAMMLSGVLLTAATLLLGRYHARLRGWPGRRD